MIESVTNAEYSADFDNIDFLGGPYCGSLSPVSISGGGTKKKKRKNRMTSYKKKNRRVSTFRKKRGSSKRKKRGSFKRRKYSKKEVVKSIMRGLGDKKKSRRKYNGGKSELATSAYGQSTMFVSDNNTESLKELNEREKQYLKNTYADYDKSVDAKNGDITYTKAGNSFTFRLKDDYRVAQAPNNYRLYYYNLKNPKVTDWI